jgi:putative intracellular protease/amidase
MWDLVDDVDSLEIIRRLADNDKLISGVCHGTAALLNAKLSDGSYLVKGAEVTGFSNEEDEYIGMAPHLPWLLETKLGGRGAKYVKAEKMYGDMVAIARGGKLITGQNPNSVKSLSEAILKALQVEV